VAYCESDQLFMTNFARISVWWSIKIIKLCISFTKKTSASQTIWPLFWILNTPLLVIWHYRQGRSDGVYRYIYPANQSTLNFFMWLFCLLDPFMPTQIQFLATPLTTRCGKKYPLKLFAIIWATAWNFNAKFHTLITSLYLRAYTSQAAFDILLPWQSYIVLWDNIAIFMHSKTYCCNE